MSSKTSASNSLPELIDPTNPSTSCSFEDQSSSSPTAETAYEDLDYDEDSVKNSPTKQPDVEPCPSPESIGSPKPVRKHAIPCRSPSALSDVHKEEDARLVNKNGESTTSDLNDKEMGESESHSNSTSRIKSIINFSRDNETPDSPGESTKRREKDESDRSHKSYDSLMKYFLKDACYFQMKSINHENIALSKSLGVWSTPIQNEVRLNTAFKRHRSVILIFSVQQSGAFQGFARMVSEAGPTNKPVPWVLPARLSKKSLGGVLRVEWLCTKDLPFHETQDLYNPFNDNKPIKVARDGQQVEAKAGKKLCKLFPQDSRRRLLDAVSTLKRQLSHRKKLPIQVPDRKTHYHRNAHVNENPYMHMHHAHLPYHMPSAYSEPSYYSNHQPPYMAPYRNRAMRPDHQSEFDYDNRQRNTPFFQSYSRQGRRRDFR